MRSKIKKRLLDRVVFPAGLALLLAGSVILLRSAADGSTARIAGSLALMSAGGAGAVFFARKRRRPTYLFFSVFFMLAGLYLLLNSGGALPLRQGWPLLSVFAGIALIPAGLLRFGGLRRVYMIPSAALASLGAFLLLFSLDITNFSFRAFMLASWPVLIALSGLFLALLTFARSLADRETGRKHDD